jgi:uncharacterized protein YjbJ (UPF0337 family)
MERIVTTIWHKIAGKWKQFIGDIIKRWGDLTNDEGMKINGNREILAGKIQERFGVTKLKVKKQLDEQADSLKA